MKEECIVCKKPLVYLEQDEVMECFVCHKKEKSKTKCVDGHYICNKCHTKGLDGILQVCLSCKDKNPYDVYKKLVDMDFCHMHGPEHHVIVGASLLVAYKNCGGDVDLQQALKEMISRGEQVPGGTCGFWGACGAGISVGIFVSIITKATPLTNKPWGLSNQMTSNALGKIAEVGGPRCCKRNSYIAIQTAVEFAKQNLGVSMPLDQIKCAHQSKNNQCIGIRCPFFNK